MRNHKITNSFRFLAGGVRGKARIEGIPRAEKGQTQNSAEGEKAKAGKHSCNDWVWSKVDLTQKVLMIKNKLCQHDTKKCYTTMSDDGKSLRTYKSSSATIIAFLSSQLLLNEFSGWVNGGRNFHKFLLIPLAAFIVSRASLPLPSPFPVWRVREPTTTANWWSLSDCERMPPTHCDDKTHTNSAASCKPI